MSFEDQGHDIHDMKNGRCLVSKLADIEVEQRAQALGAKADLLSDESKALLTMSKAERAAALKIWAVGKAAKAWVPEPLQLLRELKKLMAPRGAFAPVYGRLGVPVRAAMRGVADSEASPGVFAANWRAVANALGARSSMGSRPGANIFKAAQHGRAAHTAAVPKQAVWQGAALGAVMRAAVAAGTGGAYASGHAGSGAPYSRLVGKAGRGSGLGAVKYLAGGGLPSIAPRRAAGGGVDSVAHGLAGPDSAMRRLAPWRADLAGAAAPLPAAPALSAGDDSFGAMVRRRLVGATQAASAAPESAQSKAARHYDVAQAVQAFFDRQTRLPPASGAGFDPRVSPIWAGVQMPG